jgi:hypothetical protein
VPRPVSRLCDCLPRQALAFSLSLLVALIVEFDGILHAQGQSLVDAVVQSWKIRMRPILMTPFATLLGMIPLALGLEAGSAQYAPLARHAGRTQLPDRSAAMTRIGARVEVIADEGQWHPGAAMCWSA